MTAGLTLYSDISARVNDIIEDSLAVARMGNVLVPTVTTLSATGMFTRKVNQYNAITFSQVGESDDLSAQVFSKSALSELTPVTYGARVDITDERAASDFDSEMARASAEFGAASAANVDASIASYFGSVTGGTIGAAGSIVTWRYITKALALLQNVGKISPTEPVFCALHPYVWEVLLSANSVAAATVAVAPGYQDAMVSSTNFFRIPSFVGITFVISGAITVDSSIDAKGCMYVPAAFAVDTRMPFEIEPERNASRRLTELNGHMTYAAGTWEPTKAVCIYTDAATPAT